MDQNNYLNLQIYYTQSMSDKKERLKKACKNINNMRNYAKTQYSNQQDELKQRQILFIDICIVGGDQQEKFQNNLIGIFLQTFGKKGKFDLKAVSLPLPYQLSKYSKRKIIYGGHQISFNITHFITHRQLLFSFKLQLEFIAKNNNQAIILFSHYETIEKAKLFRDFLEPLVSYKKKLGLPTKLLGLIVLEVPKSSDLFVRQNILRRSRRQFMKVGEDFSIGYIEIKESQPMQIKYNDIVKLIGLQKVNSCNKVFQCQNLNAMRRKYKEYKIIYDKERENIEKQVWRYIQIKQSLKSLGRQIKRAIELVKQPLNRIRKRKIELLTKIGNFFRISNHSPDEFDGNHLQFIHNINQKIKQCEEESFMFLNNLEILNLVKIRKRSNSQESQEILINYGQVQISKADKAQLIRLQYFQSMKKSICDLTELHPTLSKKIPEIKSINLSQWKKLVMAIQSIETDIKNDVSSLEDQFNLQTIFKRDNGMKCDKPLQLLNKIDEEIKGIGKYDKYLSILKVLDEVRDRLPSIESQQNENILWQLRIEKQSLKAKLYTVANLLDIKIRIAREIGRSQDQVPYQQENILCERLQDYFVSSHLYGWPKTNKKKKEDISRSVQRQEVEKKQKLMQDKALMDKIQNEMNKIQKYYSKFYKFIILEHNLTVLDYL